MAVVYYLALAHRALTSFSLMSSHLLSWSICRSRSLMSPMVKRTQQAEPFLPPHTLAQTPAHAHYPVDGTGVGVEPAE